MGLAKLFKTGDYKFDRELKGVVTEEEIGDEILIKFHPKKYLEGKEIELWLWDYDDESLIPKGNIGELRVSNKGYEYRLTLITPKAGCFIQHKRSLSAIESNKEIILARIVWNLEGEKYSQILNSSKNKSINLGKS